MRLLTKSLCGFFMLSVLGLVFGDAIVAQDKAKDKKKEVKKVELKVKAGDTAPAFESVDENGKAVKSADLVGKKIVVLYFYPADFTGGCTTQACGFRDGFDKLGKDVVVFGVSGDSVATHKLFKAHHKLPFSLLADGKGEVAKAFGIPVGLGEKTAKGVNEKGEKVDVVRTATINRFTVVIGLDGKVADISSVGSTGGDAARVTAIIAKLAK